MEGDAGFQWVGPRLRQHCLDPTRRRPAHLGRFAHLRKVTNLGKVRLRSSLMNSWLPFCTGFMSGVCPGPCLCHVRFFLTVEETEGGLVPSTASTQLWRPSHLQENTQPGITGQRKEARKLTHTAHRLLGFHMKNCHLSARFPHSQSMCP